MSDVKCQMSRKGLIALPSIILISILVLVAGLGIATSGFFEIAMSTGALDSAYALNYAEIGAEDALARVVKNRYCNEDGLPACSSYTITLTYGTSTITVTGTSTKTILSEGSSETKRRKIQAVISFDENNEAAQTSWQELIN